MADEPEVAAAEADKPDEWWTALETERQARGSLELQVRQKIAEFQAQLASIKLPPAQITRVVDRSVRPWWAPDAQGMLAGGILLIAAAALFVRMLHTSTIDDKMLDTMITILFSTCLVIVYQYTFGSSRGSDVKTATQDKLVEKLVPTVEAKS